MKISITGNRECGCQSQVQITSMMMKRKASSLRQGDLETGKSSISNEIGRAKEARYPLGTRLENGIGPNREERMALAYPGWFAMVKVPAADKNRVLEMANAARTCFPISRLLNAKLEA